MAARPSLDPPADAEMPVRHPDAAAPGERLQSHNPLCAVCGDQHPAGLRLRIYACEGLAVRSELDVSEAHQGPPALAHGGLVAAAFDETMGCVNWLMREPTVTGRLDIVFRHAVPIGATVHFRAWARGLAGRKVYMASEARLDHDAGDLVATAQAVFIRTDVLRLATEAAKTSIRTARPGPF